MYKIYFIFSFILALIIDQWSKYLSINGLRWQSDYINLVLVYNDGIAFSMLSFLQGYLKYLNLALIILLFIYLLWQKTFLKDNIIAFGLMFGAGCSNLLDRFMRKGVVDMIYWHKWFDFAIFNLADVIINISVFLILIKELFFIRKKNEFCK